jgi:hypothetical protein
MGRRARTSLVKFRPTRTDNHRPTNPLKRHSQGRWAVSSPNKPNLDKHSHPNLDKHSHPNLDKRSHPNLGSRQPNQDRQSQPRIGKHSLASSLPNLDKHSQRNQGRHSPVSNQPHQDRRRRDRMFRVVVRRVVLKVRASRFARPPRLPAQPVRPR